VLLADWVIEIASEGDPRFEDREKLPRYRSAGIGEIWLVDPFAERIAVERMSGDGYERTELASGRLESSTAPGFWIEVSWLWQEDLPSTLGCLRQILGA
jgi:Uma2 family endonuclease